MTPTQGNITIAILGIEVVGFLVWAIVYILRQYIFNEVPTPDLEKNAMVDHWNYELAVGYEQGFRDGMQLVDDEDADDEIEDLSGKTITWAELDKFVRDGTINSRTRDLYVVG